jgi:hypothetical protein
MRSKAAIAGLFVVFAFNAPFAFATAPVLTTKPSPPSLSSCQAWADRQSEDALDMWGQKSDGASSRDIAVLRLALFCLGDTPPQIVDFGSSIGFDDIYCRSHKREAICAQRP